MIHTTLAQLGTLKLNRLAAGLEELLSQSGMAAMSIEERMTLFINREVHAHNDRKLERLLIQARLDRGRYDCDAIKAGVMQRNHRLTMTSDLLRQEKPKSLK